MHKRHERLGLPGQPQSVSTGRHFLTLTLAEWGLSPLTETVALAATEVLTNAVVHAGTPIEVVVQLAEELTVSVRDDGPPWTAEPAGPGGVGLPPWDSEGGRGLALIEAVSDAWGVRTEPAGKTVWFSLARPAQPAGRVAEVNWPPVPLPTSHASPRDLGSATATAQPPVPALTVQLRSAHRQAAGRIFGDDLW